MKLILLFLALLFCSRCREPQSNTATGRQEITRQSSPQEIQSLLARKQSGWSLPDTSDYRIWWSFFEKGTTPYYVAADINDDELLDYAVILKKGERRMIHILVSSGKTFTHWTDDEIIPRPGQNSEYGLNLIEPRQLDFILAGREQSLVFLSNAIGLMELEKLMKVYYWADGKPATAQISL